MEVLMNAHKVVYHTEMKLNFSYFIPNNLVTLYTYLFKETRHKRPPLEWFLLQKALFVVKTTLCYLKSDSCYFKDTVEEKKIKACF